MCSWLIISSPEWMHVMKADAMLMNQKQSSNHASGGVQIHYIPKRAVSEVQRQDNADYLFFMQILIFNQNLFLMVRH